MTDSTHTSFCSLGAFVGALFLASGCHPSAATKPPYVAPSNVPSIPFKPIPTPKAVSLTASSVDLFVDWVSAIPTSQVAEVKNQIALVKSDPKVVDAVAAKLSFRHPGSYGRQLIYLSILGEMKNERALGPLQTYLNSRDCLVFEESMPAQKSVLPGTTHFDACGGLKSAAVNMIAYLDTAAARTVVLRAISDHASRSVRLSAMDAFLYNSGDSAEGMEAVRRHARPNEAKFAGLPRLSPDLKPHEFEARVARFYREHPEDWPPLPVMVATKLPAQRHGRPDHLSLTPTAGPSRGQQ